jgi:DNA polymerase-1
MMSEDKTLVLVDGSALAFRSFYALFTAGMRRSDGSPSWAVFGFFKALFDLLERQKPEMLAVCFDLAAPTFRHLEYDEYKANRSQMPDDLSVQWPLIKEGVEALSIPVYELAGYEADDLIGTVAKKAAGHGYKVIILTGDQDAFQLLDGDIQVLMPGRDGLSFFGREQVFAKLGVWPEQIIDYKALCGDSSDNIPGVKGVGPKTAVTLLSEFQTLERVYENIEKVKSNSVRQKLVEGREIAFKSQRLATILLDVPFQFDFDHCRLAMPDPSKAIDFFRTMEFNSILKRLPNALAPFNGGVAPVIDQQLLTPVAVRRSVPGVNKATGIAAVAEVEPVVEAATGQLAIPLLTVVTSSAPEPQVIRTAEQLSALKRELAKQPVLSVDLETTGLDCLDCEVVGYALAWSDAARLSESGRLDFGISHGPVKTAYVPVRHRDEEQLAPELVAAELKEILQADKVGKIAQNAKFEMNVLSLLGIKFGPLAFDPMLASYIANPDEKHGLKDQSERILNYTMVRIAELIGSGRKQISMTDVPVSKAAPYAADDARVALELARYYVPRLDADQRFLLWEMEMPLSAVLAKMEQAGVALDIPYLEQFSCELTCDLKRLEGEIHQLAGHEFNINSTQQLQKVLFEELKLPVKSRSKTKSGGYSTDAAVLEGLLAEHPIVGKVLEFRQDSKLRSTYVDALPRQISPRDHRLHGEFNQVTTATGRLSSSNPNLQNIPIKTALGRRIRRAFVPEKESSLLISADYSQIELRILAHLSADETLLDAFNRDQDIHARTAVEIFDVPLEQVTSDMRRVGKTINFSLIYQQGAYSTAQDLGISNREAQAFIEKYFQRYPKVRSFMTQSIEECRRNGYARTLWGRRRYFRYLNDRNDMIRRADERAAANAPLQGSAADLMKLAMIKLDQELEQRKLNGQLIMQVHDELVLEVPAAELEETKQVVQSAMELGQPLNVPLKVDVADGSTWMDI